MGVAAIVAVIVITWWKKKSNKVVDEVPAVSDESVFQSGKKAASAPV